MPRVVARACCRVDLAGGTLDIWPLGLLHPGARTVNLAIDIEVRVELETVASGWAVEQEGERLWAATPAELARLPGGELVGLIAAELELPPLVARLASASPRGGGLGASSALGVAIVAAGESIAMRPPSPAAWRAAVVRDLEARLMGRPTGLQDHFPALLGGALEIVHAPGGERVRRLAGDLETLAASLVVVFTGQSHVSGETNWQVVRRRLEGDSEMVRLFAGISEVACELAVAIENGSLVQVGRLLTAEWELRRQLAEGVSTPELERLLSDALEAGAWGGKVCGAGGGGCAVLLCPPHRRAAVERAVEGAGGRRLEARPSSEPVRVHTLP